MSEQSQQPAPARKPRRDAGAPAAPTGQQEETATLAVPNARTLAPESPALEDVQSGLVAGAVVGTSLPIGEEQLGEQADPGPFANFTGTALPATVAPFGAPAGSTWQDGADQQPSQRNEIDGGPRLAYVVAWNKAAIHVDPEQAQTRTVGEGDDAREEKYLTVQSATGSREVVLEGEQVTLERGEALPDSVRPGEGQLLLSFGAVQSVSVTD